jgi:hypothetical protein
MLKALDDNSLKDDDGAGLGDPLTLAKKRLTQFQGVGAPAAADPAPANDAGGSVPFSNDMNTQAPAAAAPAASPAPLAAAPPPAAAPPIPPPPPPPEGVPDSPDEAPPAANVIPTNLPQLSLAQTQQAPVGSADRVQEIYQQQQHPEARPDRPSYSLCGPHIFFIAARG